MNEVVFDRDLVARYHEVFEADDPPVVPNARITAIVLVYNEALRLPHFLDHHAKLGVGHFIVVDNASDDGSAAILDENPHVTRICTKMPYSENKAAWREVLADLYLSDRWALFVDADELLVYPGWPERDLDWFCDLMDARGYRALFTTMVDMYPDKPLSTMNYEAGSPFLNAAPWFDTGNYRLIPLEPKAQKLWPTPHYRVFGGARERLFSEGRDRQPNLLDRMILRFVFSLRRGCNPGARRQSIDRRALAYVQGSFQELSPPNMSKIPLLRWQAGCKFAGGPHRVDTLYAMSDDWGTLLHFKYLDDFGTRSSEAVTRGQHSAGAAHYKLYLNRMEDVSSRSLKFSGSRKFRNWLDLVRARLMRVSPQTRKAMREACSKRQSPDHD